MIKTEVKVKRHNQDQPVTHMFHCLYDQGNTLYFVDERNIIKSYIL